MDDNHFESFFHMTSDDSMSVADILEKEIEEGNIEYKLKLVNLSDEQILHRVTQLNWRLNESNNLDKSSFDKKRVADRYEKDVAIYFIGVEDNGFPIGISKSELKQSIQSLYKIAYEAKGELVIKSILRGRNSLASSSSNSNSNSNSSNSYRLKKKSLKSHQSSILTDRYVAEVIVRRSYRENIVSDKSQIQVALAGDFDSGKSTLIGVLATGHYDNGKGSARMHIFQHDHELSSGRTSSISQHNIYYDIQGNVLNNNSNRSRSNSVANSHCNSHNSSQINLTESSSSSSSSSTATTSVTPSTPINSKSNLLKCLSEFEMSKQASRIVSFLDLAGHVKYLKTTLYGLVAHAPDTCLLCISARRGIQNMTSEHLGVILALKLNLCLVITKIDSVSSTKAVDDLVSNIINLLSNKTRKLIRIDTLQQLQENLLLQQKQGKEEDHNILSQNNTTYTPKSIENDHTNNDNTSVTLIPVFVTSSVTGVGLDLLSNYFFTFQNNKSMIKPIFSTTNNNDNNNNNNHKDKNSSDNKSANSPTLRTKSETTTHKSINNNNNNNTLCRIIGSFKQRGISTTNTTNVINNNSNNNDSNSSNDMNESVTKDVNKNVHTHTAKIISETVLLVIVHKGQIKTKDIYYFGPFTIRGVFLKMRIRSIRVNNFPVDIANEGQTATVTLISAENHKNSTDDSSSSLIKMFNHLNAPTTPDKMFSSTSIYSISPSSSSKSIHHHSPDILPHTPSTASTSTIAAATGSTYSHSLSVSANASPARPSFIHSHSQSPSLRIPSPMPLLRRGRSNSLPVLHSHTHSHNGQIDYDDDDSSTHESIVDENSQNNYTADSLLRSSSISCNPSFINDPVELSIYSSNINNDENIHNNRNNPSILTTPASYKNTTLDSIHEHNYRSKVKKHLQTNTSNTYNTQTNVTNNYLKRRPLNGLVLLSYINVTPASSTNETSCNITIDNNKHANSPLTTSPSSPHPTHSCHSSLLSQQTPVGVWEFEAEILILNHPSKIQVNYEPVIMIDSIEQSARIIAIHVPLPSHTHQQPIPSHTPHTNTSTTFPSNSQTNSFSTSSQQHLKTGSKAICHFRFLYHPEYVVLGTSLLMREGRTRGVGTITRVFSNIFASHHITSYPLITSRTVSK